MKLFLHDGGQSDTIYAGEENTCTVRALAITANISYEDAYDIMQEAGRRPNGRIFMGMGLSKFQECGGHYECVYCRGIFSPRITLRKMLPQLEEGNYIVRVRRHVFAVVDGLVYDTELLPARNSIIETVWKVVPVDKTN
jgi:hypothetical protein